MPIEMIDEFDQGTQIKVIGVGGGGGNAVLTQDDCHNGDKWQNNNS